MPEFSILDCESISKDTTSYSPYYTDFNIDCIVKDISAYWKEDVSAFFKYMPANESGREYRKAIYADVCKEGMFESLMDFLKEMKQRKLILKNKELTRSDLQKMVMSLSEMKRYVIAVDELTSKLMQIKPESEGMIKLLELLTDYVSGDDFKTLKDETLKLRAAIDSIPIKLNYQDHFLGVTFEETEGRYDEFLKSFDKKDDTKTTAFLKRKNPLGDNVEITELEAEILKIVCKKYSQLFAELSVFVKQNEDYARDYILQLAEDVAFYLSFYTFEKEMCAKGLYFCQAEKSERNHLMANDLYDLALACRLIRKGEVPVANDMHMDEGENFFVLTGPNQGGKTTFARSLGQLVYFSKLGLPVPANKAEVPFYSRILTHFSVEESVETGKGKLAEELSRLAPMMADKTQMNDFVVINELFTTAANYDACIMGKRVLDHFIGQNCHGIYVTHLQELSKEDKGIVSLRAMMNEEHRQNFKIVRSNEPALESSILLVEKHRLHYDQVLDRLKGGDEK